ncbi:MAG TPA: hypothetical protein VH392_06290 [Sphingomicrobium sp.]
MEYERADLLEKIELCRRLSRSLTDDDMRHALKALAADYEGQLKRTNGEGFMLRDARR